MANSLWLGQERNQGCYSGGPKWLTVVTSTRGMVAEMNRCGQIWDMFRNRCADELDRDRAQEEEVRLTVFLA